MQIAMAIILDLVMGSVQSAYPQTADPRVADIIQSGKIWIGCFHPFSIRRTLTAKPQGLALKMPNALAADIGVQEVVTAEFFLYTE